MEYIKEKIEETYLKICRFIRKINRLLTYIPIIWKTYDWDYTTILEILKHSLTRYDEYCEKYGVALRKRSQKRAVRTMIFLIDRILNEEKYYDQHEEYLKNKYNIYETEFKFVQIRDDKRFKDCSRFHVLHLTKNGDILKGKKLENYNKEYSEIRLKIEKTKNSEKALLFKLLNSHLFHMWD